MSTLKVASLLNAPSGRVNVDCVATIGNWVCANANFALTKVLESIDTALQNKTRTRETRK